MRGRRDRLIRCKHGLSHDLEIRAWCCDPVSIRRMRDGLHPAIVWAFETDVVQDGHLHQMTTRRPAPASQQDRSRLLMKARTLLSERSRRTQFFSRAMFGEPAWDMLLGLYVMNGRRVSVGKLTSLVDEPKTTALRWIDYLEKEHLIEKRPDFLDRRVVWVDLLDRGRQLLDVYLSSLPDDIGALDRSC
jgi:DNA-binding MarR family transcriptional regulator